MIRDQNRSGWFGASDTARIMGRWDTPSFARWWLVKLGLRRENFKTLEMETGTAYEHPILRCLGVPVLDRQIKIRRLRLRVNLDGEDRVSVTEVKTYGRPPFQVSRPYWMQAQAEMYAAKKPLRIAAYRLEAEDYRNWFRPIDTARLSFHPVEYEESWVEWEYLPRLKHLAKCLRKGVWPHDADIG